MRDGLPGMAELIVTNGDSAADLLHLAGRTATILPWRDILHEGPVTTTDLDRLTAERVPWLAERFHLLPQEVADEFAERNRIIRAHADYDSIELWFEHDLYDQLQLVQVLAFFAAERRSDGLTLIQADAFLGMERPDSILRHATRARPVTRDDLALGAAVWSDLSRPTPEAIARRVAMAPGALPYLRPALTRFLQELPAPGNGLTRTEEALMEAIAHGESDPGRLFHAVLSEEDAAFMGDLSFFAILDDLANCDVPLIAGQVTREEGARGRARESTLRLTIAGEEVLAGDEDRPALCGLDRWWGGTHLIGRRAWRYDRVAGKLVAPGAPRR